MAVRPNSQEVIAIELRVLRFLCQNTAARGHFAVSLRNYHWRDLAHRVIYEIVCATRELSEDRLRALLAARLTNAGFPDFPWEDLFQHREESAKEVEILIRQLCESEG